MERDHRVYLSISGGEFVGLSTSGDILLPRCMRHHRNSALALPNRWPLPGCLYASPTPFRLTGETEALRSQPGR